MNSVKINLNKMRPTPFMLLKDDFIQLNIWSNLWGVVNGSVGHARRNIFTSIRQDILG